MSETTEGKSVPEALRMIAGWVEEGRAIEYFDDDDCIWTQSLAWKGIDHIYRAKPRKPRRIHCSCGFSSPSATCIEETPEVKAVLEREGII